MSGERRADANVNQTVPHGSVPARLHVECPCRTPCQTPPEKQRAGQPHVWRTKRRSWHTVLKGGATLFFTTLTLVKLPVTLSPSFSCVDFRISIRTDTANTRDYTHNKIAGANATPRHLTSSTSAHCHLRSPLDCRTSHQLCSESARAVLTGMQMQITRVTPPPTWLMKMISVFDLDRDAVSLRRACLTLPPSASAGRTTSIHPIPDS